MTPGSAGSVVRLSDPVLVLFNGRVGAWQWGDAWCNGKHIYFPSLPPMVECGFESRSGLEFSALVCGFLKLVIGDFLWVLWFPPSFIS